MKTPSCTNNIISVYTAYGIVIEPAARFVYTMTVVKAVKKYLKEYYANFYPEVVNLKQGKYPALNVHADGFAMLRFPACYTEAEFFEEIKQWQERLLRTLPKE